MTVNPPTGEPVVWHGGKDTPLGQVVLPCGHEVSVHHNLGDRAVLHCGRRFVIRARTRIAVEYRVEEVSE